LRYAVGSRKGFTLIEVAFALLIMAVILVYFVRFINVERANVRFTQGNYNAKLLAEAIPKVYKAVVNYSAPYCAPDGWSSPYCDSTIPFPILENGILKVYVDSDLPDKASLEGEIKTILTTAGCTYQGTTAVGGEDSVNFLCLTPKLTSLSYTLSDGSTTTTFQKGGVDPMHFPVKVSIGYTIDMGNGETYSRTVSFDVSYLRNSLIRESAERMALLTDALKSYYTTRLSTEVDLQPYPNGLHSTEDFYVPWEWQVLATDGKIYKTCNDDKCSGIDDWETGSPDFDTVIDRIIKNLLYGTSDYPLSLDGFMYSWRIILVGNGCSGDLTNCKADNNKPPSPNKNVTGASWYWNVYSVKPPFFSWIVSSAPSCLQNDDSPDWCRNRVVYTQ